MILETVGFILGALLAALLVFTLFSYFLDIITKYKMSVNKNLNITLGLSIAFALIWGEIWGLSPDESIIRYVPGLLVVYFFDRHRRLKKKCQHCQEKIKLDATMCKHCHIEV